MVCSLHSVTTGSRDRANVSLIIIIIIIIIVLHYSCSSWRAPVAKCGCIDLLFFVESFWGTLRLKYYHGAGYFISVCPVNFGA